MCDIQITGGNKLVPLMPGGIDGIYKLHTCENGRPAFKRQRSPPGGEAACGLCAAPFSCCRTRWHCSADAGMRYRSARSR